MKKTGLDLSSIKDCLLSQKSEILNRGTEFKMTQASSEKFSDEVDSTSQELINNVSIHLHERERKSLYLIDKALAKFADNTYGLCESCHDQISLKRLQARPLASLCISCMEEIESTQKQNLYIQ